MDKMRAFTNMVRRGIEQKWDFVMVIDGREGSGKSSLGLHMKAMYDGFYNLDHVLFNASEMVTEMQVAPRGSCIIVDEAIISLYKREALKDFQTTLVKAFSIVRARNLFFILVLPNFQDLDPNIRTRANYRLYTHAKRGVRGYLKVFQPQRTPWSSGWLYQTLIWEYKFPALPDEFQKEYDTFKESSLMETLKDFKVDIEKAVRANRSREEFGRTNTKIERLYAYVKDNPDASHRQVANAIKCSPGYARDIIRSIKEGD